MKLTKILILCLIVGALFSMTACNEKKEETRTVDWYMAQENKAALEAKLAECRNNPGELKDTPNCQNAALAQHKLFARPPSIKIQ